MVANRSRTPQYRVYQAIFSAVLGTIATSAIQGLVAIILTIASVVPEWLMGAFIFSAMLSLLAVGQMHAVLCRWQIGAAVICIGGLGLLGGQYIAMADFKFIEQPAAAQYWLLTISYGALFGGIGWLLTSLFLKLDTPRRVVSMFAKSTRAPHASERVSGNRVNSLRNGSQSIDDVVEYLRTRKPPTKLERPRESSGCFAVFVRIDRLTTKPIGGKDGLIVTDYKPYSTSEAYASVLVLKNAMNKLELGPDLVFHSSPYGGLLLVEPVLAEALLAAVRLLKETAGAGVKVAVGIAYDTKFETSRDLTGKNVIALGINLAARLAHLPGGTGSIAVHEKVANWINTEELASLHDLESRFVKKTSLNFSWLKVQPPAVGALVVPQQIAERTETAVVYDIVGFTDRNSRKLGEAVDQLYRMVKESVNTFSSEDIEESKDNIPYAPAGDGGVLIFRNAYRAWRFANELIDNANACQLDIRIGIATGQVVRVGGSQPVGRAIYEADDLASAGKPDMNCICVSEDFWLTTLGGRPEGLPKRSGKVKSPSQSTGKWTEYYVQNERLVKFRKPTKRFLAKLTVILLTSMLFSPLVIVVLMPAKQQNPTAPISEEAGKLAIEEQARREVSAYCQDRPEIIRMYSRALGISPLGGDRLRAFSQTIGEKIRTAKDTSATRTVIEKAETELLAKLLYIYHSAGQRYPAYDSPDAVGERVAFLIVRLQDLGVKSKNIKDNQLFILYLHIRLLIAMSCTTITANILEHIGPVHAAVTKIEKQQAEVGKIVEILKKEIRDASDRDVAIRFANIVHNGITADNKDVDAQKVLIGLYKETTKMIAGTSDTLLFTPQNYQLRLHVGRLQLFYSLCTLPQVVKDRIDPLMLYNSTGSIYREGDPSDLDKSFQVLRRSSQVNNLADIRMEWIDTALANFEELKQTHGKSCPWDHESLLTMVRERAKDSEDFIEKLRLAHELSPEYLLASLNIQIAAFRYFSIEPDKREFARVVSLSRDYYAKLTNGNELLLSPVRSVPPHNYTRVHLSRQGDAIRRTSEKHGFK